MNFMGIYLSLSKDSLSKGKMSYKIMKDTKNKNMSISMNINKYNGNARIIKLPLKTLKINKYSFLLNLKVEMTASHLIHSEIKSVNL